jgi:serine/threonine protein kinase
MLYGKFPWNGETLVTLLKNIKKNDILFHATPTRSEKIKDLIKHMLEKDEEKRY